eukprot:1147597-Pelagomonas_calceolata.AAC.1
MTVDHAFMSSTYLWQAQQCPSFCILNLHVNAGKRQGSPQHLVHILGHACFRGFPVAAGREHKRWHRQAFQVRSQCCPGAQQRRGVRGAQAAPDLQPAWSKHSLRCFKAPFLAGHYVQPRHLRNAGQCLSPVAQGAAGGKGGLGGGVACAQELKHSFRVNAPPVITHDKAPTAVQAHGERRGLSIDAILEHLPQARLE